MRYVRMLALVGLAGLLAASSSAQPQVPQPNQKTIIPKLVPMAETRLLMEGLAHPNFKGLERILKQKPAEDQAWTFGRGQALLIAETANLLMLRPPRNSGEPLWFERSMELRGLAGQLAQTLAKRDFEGSRAGLQKVADSCNRCHQTFRVKVQIAPFADNAAP